MCNKYPVFEYWATNPYNNARLYAHTFRGIKRRIKEERWKLGWISTEKGALSYGQNVVDSYPYKPRYK